MYISSKVFGIIEKFACHPCHKRTAINKMIEAFSIFLICFEQVVAGLNYKVTVEATCGGQVRELLWNLISVTPLDLQITIDFSVI